MIIAICSIIMVGELGSVISFASKNAEPATVIVNNGEKSVSTTTTMSGSTAAAPTVSTEPVAPTTSSVTSEFNTAENVCAGAKLDLPNVACVVDAVTNVGPQAGANVTKGYVGDLAVDYTPITTPYYQQGMCPVNVHWHLGAEHLSVGEYDENGTGPAVDQNGVAINNNNRALAEERVDQGFRCNKYDESEPMFTTPFEWKHCVGMQVGETYEVHWPHSAAGACGTPNQYQTPFYDGVFCNLDMETLQTLTPQDIANAVGVQAQVFTIVNDEQYFYPDLMRGMIVEGDKGADMAIYTGSTTGSSRDNDICSSYSPITWQVDRKCHLISASTFDQMCADMMNQRDDMSEDLHAHGSRDLVDSQFVADNQQNRFLRA